MAKRKRRRKKTWSKPFVYEVLGWALLAISILALARLGVAGHTVIDFFRFFGGNWSPLFLVGLILISLYFIWQRQSPDFWSRRLVGCYLFIFAILLMAHVQFFSHPPYGVQWNGLSAIQNTWEVYWSELSSNLPSQELGGGMIGAVGYAFCHTLFSDSGTNLVAVILMILAFILITGKSLGAMLSSFTKGTGTFLKNRKNQFQQELKDWKEDVRTKRKQQLQEKGQETNDLHVQIQEQGGIQRTESGGQEIEPIIHDFSEYESKKPASDVPDGGKVESPTFSTSEVENKDYQLPPLNLLVLPQKSAQNVQKQNISENARKLERTFESFGVRAKIRKVHVGPAVTKYEVYPDVGVKVSKIVSLNDDIALALAAKEIRIEAPIPGKSAVGIEVPNEEVSMVTLREVLESEEAEHYPSKLMIGLGRDISGSPVLADLSDMPHILVAGATGAGKSVCINAMITSILTRAKPHEVKMIMIDPKMVELNIYNGVPHLLTPVVIDPKKASQALKKVVDEMERRYELFSDSGTRNIEAYNRWLAKENDRIDEKHPVLPYIVVIVDELADLMMVAPKDVEDSITRLSQMARASGIHLIIATQRPSVDVITGVIKANIPSRIAFNVSSQIDSRTILDMGGADRLLGKGDMLFLPVGASKPMRIQGAFLSDAEVEHMVDFVISQQKAQYQADMTPDDEPEQPVDIEDEYYHDAVQLIIDLNSASVSMLQRRFRIGYTRAARLIDAMEAAGIVGPYEGSKPRKVLVSGEKTQVSGN